MPAHRKPSRRRELRRLKVHTVSRKGYWPKIVKFLVVLLIPIGIIFYVLLTTKFWDGSRKMSMAVMKPSGDVSLAVFDPVGKSITVINIPGTTQVEVSQNIGTWRLKNVKTLGDKKGQGGQLLVSTLTKHFEFPVYIWSDETGEGFLGEGVWGGLKSLFKPFNTNLGFGDKIRLFYFNLSVKDFKKEVIDLPQTRYIKKSVLNDGEEGYILASRIPAKISAIFSDPDLPQNSSRTRIIDKTGMDIGEHFGEIMEVLGFKVVSVSNTDTDNSDCTVEGKDQHAVKLVTLVFSCEQKANSDTGMDLTITLGSDFGKRF